jgi:hypothetical protein
MNPEDRENVGGTQFFTDRITFIKIPYVLDCSTEAKIKEEVSYLMENLNWKYGYTAQGAKEVCIYVIDNDLARAFAQQ